MKKTTDSTDGLAPHQPIGRATRRVRKVVQTAKCSEETKLVLRAIQAATEDIACLVLQSPNEKILDITAVIEHAAKAIGEAASSNLDVISGRKPRAKRQR